MSVLPSFDLHRPTSLTEAMELISPDDLPYVGGTELLLALRQGLLRPRSLVSLRSVAGLGSIEIESRHLRIGASVTHRQAARDDGVGEALPILPTVLRRVGNPRVQTSGTLAGNLCFAEPKSDIIPLLVALEATVVLERLSSTARELAVEDFVLGPYITARQPDELLTWIRIPLVRGRRTTYLKFQTMERPTVGVAAARFDDGGTPRVRLVVGAAGMEVVVVDGPADTIEPEAIADRIDPIPDLTGSADYKRHVTSVFTARALRELEVMA